MPSKYPEFSEVLAVAKEQASVWRSSDGNAYITVAASDEDISLESRRFGAWLRYEANKRGLSPVRRATVTQVADHLTSVATFDGPEFDLAIRVAKVDGSVYVDLGGSNGVARIGPGGWTPANPRELPVRFRRSATSLPLPYPGNGGDVDLLRGLVNVPGEEDFRLLVGFIVGCYSDGPFPVLCLEGGEGCGKSSTADVVQRLVDPDALTRVTKPKNPEDVMVAARTRRLLVFDNLSGVRPWFSDLLAVLSTGGSYPTRRFHTNTEEVVFTKRAPVVLTGIDRIADRADLASRSITLELPPISKRLTEGELAVAADDRLPFVLSAVFEGISAALDRGFRVGSKQRLADHIAWVEAAAPAFGWKEGDYDEAFRHMQARLRVDAVDRDGFLAAVVAFVKHVGKFSGTSTAVLRALDDDQWAPPTARRSRHWPKSAQEVGIRLRRARSTLESMAVVAEQGTGRARRTWTLERRVTLAKDVP